MSVLPVRVVQGRENRMITVFSDKHKLHHGQKELIGGKFVPPFENPRRADLVIERVRNAGLGEVRAPDDYGAGPIMRVHTPKFVEFMRTAYGEWQAVHGDTDALPLCWPNRGLRQVIPEEIDGKLSFYTFDAATPVTAGTWAAITSSVNVALSGADILRSGQRGVFSLCRPPGHHASADLFGGYCFFNNVAIAAQALLDEGAGRVAILDIDYHHGNGTQSIFYDREDVLFVSIHADPAQEFPFFLGYANESGQGEGDGYNLNIPLRWGTGWSQWQDALSAGLARIRDYGPDAILVSLGVDTFSGDPISKFKLSSEHFPLIGEQIAGLQLPTLFVLEGGYAVDEIGINVVNVLSGFEQC